MYSYDDRWMLEKTLTLVEFNIDGITVFECKAITGEFYNNRLRRLVVTDLTNLHRTDGNNGDDEPITESFRIQHGEPMPNTRYLGVSQHMCHMDRYFRILSQRVTFPLGSFLGVYDYELAGLPGEGQGVLDEILDEIR